MKKFHRAIGFMKMTHLTMNKPVYLGLLILHLMKTVLHEFWYDYIKRKSIEKVRLCYMNTSSFIAHIKIEYIYKDITENFKTRFDTSNYEIDRQLPIGKK